MLRRLYRRVEEVAFAPGADVSALIRHIQEGEGGVEGADLRLVAGVRQTKDGVEVKFADRVRLMELLMALGEKLDQDSGSELLEELLAEEEP